MGSVCLKSHAANALLELTTNGENFVNIDGQLTTADIDLSKYIIQADQDFLTSCITYMKLWNVGRAQ